MLPIPWYVHEEVINGVTDYAFVFVGVVLVVGSVQELSIRI